MNSQKGFVVPLTIAIVALLAIGGVVFVTTNKKLEAPAVVDNQIATTTDETKDWKTYTNNTLGYSIKYPGVYNLEEKDVLLSEKFVSSVSIQITDPANQPKNFGPYLLVDIIKQPYDISGVIFTNVQDFTKDIYKNQNSYRDLIFNYIDLKGTAVVEVSGKVNSEVGGWTQFKSSYAIKNNIIYQISYYPFDYRYFSDIALTFRFINSTTTNPIIGGDKDEHGCLGPAGYSWCAVKNKCLRVWEEKCEVVTTTTNPVACTMDAMMCPDGTYVGRSGPDCKFVCPK
jgi:hypothetical protein